MATNHTIILGPGRVGGTLLMKIFTELGIDTGFPKNTEIEFYKGCRFEWPVRGTRMKKPVPYLIKEPQMCTDIDLRIEAQDWKVDHVYICLRRPGPIACALDFQARGKPVGWEKTLEPRNLDKATRGFAARILQATHLVAEMDIPHTLVSFPRWAEDPTYFYNKFKFLMDKYNISKADATEALKACVSAKEIKRVKADMPEWLRRYMREWIT